MAASAISMSGVMMVGGAPAAHASTFMVKISVAANGAATGSVGGIGATYTAVLTASGAGTCTLANGPTVIADFGIGSGNPAVATTRGGCTLYNATADYTLTYTSVAGVTSTWYRSCVWTLGLQTCTPEGATI